MVPEINKQQRKIEKIIRSQSQAGAVCNRVHLVSEKCIQNAGFFLDVRRVVENIQKNPNHQTCAENLLSGWL